jgi:hypothetical protein
MFLVIAAFCIKASWMKIFLELNASTNLHNAIGCKTKIARVFEYYIIFR